MVYPIINQILIILITVGCFLIPDSFFLPGGPWYLLAVAAFLMVIMTYTSFSQEEGFGLENVLKLIGMSLYGILSGSFLGCLVFAMLKELKGSYRVLLATAVFAITIIIKGNNQSLAIYLIEYLILLVALILLMLIFTGVSKRQAQKQREQERLTLSNIGELHEKRLNEQLLIQNAMAEKNARLMERESISRNIHNSVGHSITAAIMSLEAADVLYDAKPEEARKRMNDANDRIRGSLDSIRRAVRVLDENATMVSFGDLKFEMQTIIREFVMDTSIRVYEDYEELPEEAQLLHELAEFLTGALQEFLTNGVKHGGADEFIVVLMGDAGHLRMVVSDNGKSDFSNANRDYRIEQGFGLKKIISYVENKGGKADFSYENGFKVQIELPII